MKKGIVTLLALGMVMGAAATPAMAAKKAAAKPAAPAMTVESCKAFIAAETEKEAKLKAYREGFAEASTANDLQLFIDMFEGNDPDKLVPQAKEKLKALQSSEAAQ